MKISEKQLENSILQYLAMRNDCFAFKFKDQSKRINNSYRRNPWEVNGVSDICVLLADGRTLWVEIKTDAGRQSKSQIFFEKKVKEFGGEYFIARSIEDVKAILP